MTIHNVQGYPLLSKTYVRDFFWIYKRILNFAKTNKNDMDNKTNSISSDRNFPGLDEFLGDETNIEISVETSPAKEKKEKGVVIPIEEKIEVKPVQVAKENKSKQKPDESSVIPDVRKEEKVVIPNVQESTISKESKECHFFMSVEGYNELMWFSRIFNMKLAVFILFLLEKEKPSLKKEILKKFGPSNQ